MKPAITVWPKNRYLLLVAALAGSAFMGWHAHGCYRFMRGPKEQTFHYSPSPDGGFCVDLVSVPAGLVDFQFEVRLWKTYRNAGDALVRSVDEETLFRSPDEVPNLGTYRVLWATDGSRFVLVGRGMYVVKGATLASGECLYLMYDLQERKLWCNASQDASRPRFTIGDVRAVEWAQFPGIQPADRTDAAGDSGGRAE